MSPSRTASLLLFTLLLPVASIQAQTFEELSGLRLSASPAGMRDAAMGASTGAAASDPGAAIVNPAAIAGMKRTSMSAIVTRSSYASESVPGSGGAILFRGSAAASSLSQIAVVLPAGRFVVSGYFNDAPRLHSNPSPAAVAGPDVYVPATQTFLGYNFSPQPQFDSRDRQFGSAIAWRIGSLEMGVGGELRDLDQRSAIVRTGITSSGDSAASERLFRTMSGHAFIPNAGIVWRATQRVSIAVAYKGGGSFERLTSVCGIGAPNAIGCRTEIAQLNRVTQKMPDRTRVALALQATPSLLLTAAAVRQGYGSFSWEPYGILGEATVTPYRNVVETHVGAEYRAQRWPVALRAGWWRDPSHVTQFPGASNWSRAIDHATVGAGVTLRGTELSFAIDDGGAHGGRRGFAGLSYTF